jgi:hypothetical protein
MFNGLGAQGPYTIQSGTFKELFITDVPQNGYCFGIIANITISGGTVSIADMRKRKINHDLR